MASPYQVLGVDPDADRETVERRYRELVKEVHPDAGGSAEEFKRVKRAYRAIVNEGSGGSSGTSSQGGASGSTGTGRSRETGPTGPGSSRSAGGGTSTGSGRSGADSRRSESTRTGPGSTGSRGRSADGRTGTGGGGTGSERQRRTGAAGAAGAAGGTGGGSRRQYTAAGRENRASGAASSGGAAGGTGSRSGRGGDRETGRSGGSTVMPRRWFLYGFSAIFAGAAYALRDQTLSDILNDDGGGEPPDRSAAAGLPREGTESREVSPAELFDVEFETPTESTVRFTVDGADTRDWINVYTREEYERVAENWDGEGRFDPGDPLETVLTDDGYVAELPEGGTYVILVKLWSGPPDDPREPRTVEVSYEVTG